MPARLPSFRMIEAFEAAARHQNFARAAEELNLTHSAISHSVRGLEARIGLPLFQRYGRRVTLTSAGRILAEQVRLTLAKLADALADGPPRSGASRQVVGAPPEFAAHVLLPCLSEGRLLDTFDVRIAATPTDLDDAEVDLLILRGPPPPGLDCHRLGADPLWAVWSPGAPPGDQRLAFREPPLVQNRLCPWEAWPDATKSLARRDRGMVVDNWSLAIDAALAGAGVCLAPRSLIRRAVDDGRLARVTGLEIPYDDGYLVAWSPERPPTGAGRLLIARLE